MVKPGKTPAQKIEVLLRHRRRVAETNRNAIGAYGGPEHEQMLVEHDAELIAAIAAWPQRPLAGIDGHLRELGIDDVHALEQALAKITEEHRVRQMAEIEAALSPSAEYQIIVL